MHEEKSLTILDENGKIIPYEEFEAQFKEFYNEAKEAIEGEEKHNCLCEDSTLSTFTEPETQINSEDVLNTFSFIDRTLYLTTEITHEHAIAFSDVIRFWNYIDRLDNIPEDERIPIKIYIDTPGGDLDATFSIIDSIKLSKTPVWTITIGSGFSGGFFIGIVGDKRIGYPNSSYLFHEGSCQSGGDAHKYLQFGKFYETRLSYLKNIVLDNTKITSDEYKKHRKDDLYLDANTAVKYGVIDEIATELI